MGEVLSCTDGAGWRSGAFISVVANLEACRLLGTGVKPEVGGNSQESSEEKEFSEGISGVVATNNG